MAGGNGDPVLWTPDGLVGTGTRDKVELSKGLMEWFAQFELFAQHFRLGLHCSLCKADLVGKNADTDRIFTVACQCREFVGRNRDFTPTAENWA